MNISSILITILGIIIILALYLLSRAGQNNVHKKEISKLPDIKDADGNKFTSVLDDIPASDVSNIKEQSTEISSTVSNSNSNSTVSNAELSKKQLVLFISAKDDSGLDGSLIKQTLLDNDLTLGDKDIYHYHVNADSSDKSNQQSSLFRVANGVEPWTLTDDDLIDKKLVGISIVMLLPNIIANKEATSLFVTMADNISNQVNGVLKNQRQELLSKNDRSEIFKS